MEIWDEVIKEYNNEINNLRLTLGNGSAEDYMEGDEICITFDKIKYNSCKKTLELHPRFLRKPLMSINIGRYYGEKVKGKKKINYEHRFYDLVKDRINLVIE